MSDKLRISELTSTVETQKEQLKRYEGRLRDIIRAYKSLQKEKEALEASVKALSVVEEEEEEEGEDREEQRLVQHQEQQQQQQLSSQQQLQKQQSSEDSAPSSPAPSLDSSTCVVSSPSLNSPAGQLPLPAFSLQSHSDTEDVASSVDPASASEAEKTDSEDVPDDHLHRQSQKPQQQQPQQQKLSSSPQPQQDHQKYSRLKSQVATLSNSLAAITKEKNKMESSFQADKRRSKEEREELAAALAAEKAAREAEVADLKARWGEAKTKLRSHQLEREGEQSDHVVMLSELQTLLTQQKRARETLEQRLEEEKTEKKKLQTALQAQEAMAAFAMKPGASANKAEEEKPKPTLNMENHPVVVKLKKDLQDVKMQLHRALQQEKHRAREAEEEILRVKLSLEEAVSNLEARIAELSATVGTYERLRVQDQSSIDTLKDELEKRLVSDASPSSLMARSRTRLPPIGADQEEEDEADDGSGFKSSNDDQLIKGLFRNETCSSEGYKLLINDELSSDPRYLLSKMKDLKTKMQVVVTSPLFDGNEVTTEEIVEKLFDKMELAELHLRCRQESVDLRAEANRLRDQLQVVTQTAKAQSPVKISSAENDQLKDRIAELEREALVRQEEAVAKERKWKKDVEFMKEEIFRVENEKTEVRREEEDKWKDKLDEVVKEMKKQRDRTVTLLRQKEAEVEAARNDAVEMVASHRERALSRSSHRSRHNSTTLSDDRRSSSVELGGAASSVVVPAGSGSAFGFSERVREDFSATGHQLESALSPDANSPLPAAGQTLHIACREAVSHLEAELKLSRKYKSDLEMALRKVQNNLAVSEENHRLDKDQLSREIDRLVKNQQRSSELGGEKNLEYLKNVVFRLITSRNSASKLQLIPVVATILQFSDDERHKSLAKYQSWWGSSSSSKSSTSSTTLS